MNITLMYFYYWSYSWAFTIGDFYLRPCAIVHQVVLDISSNSFDYTTDMHEITVYYGKVDGI